MTNGVERITCCTHRNDRAIPLTTLVFGTGALLAFYLAETGGKKVEAHLEDITRGDSEGFLNVANLCELYYILCRKSPDVAAEKEQNLRSYGVSIVPIDEKNGIWREAARIKASHALLLADAFAAATAKMINGTLVVGRDAEFAQIKGIRIERIR